MFAVSRLAACCLLRTVRIRGVVCVCFLGLPLPSLAVCSAFSDLSLDDLRFENALRVGEMGSTVNSNRSGSSPESVGRSVHELRYLFVRSVQQSRTGHGSELLDPVGTVTPRKITAV